MNIKAVLKNATICLLVVFAIPGMVITYRRCVKGFLVYEVLHPIRENYQRMPSLAYLFKQPPADISAQLQELNHHGIVHIKNFFNFEQLKTITTEFNACIDHIEKYAKGVRDDGAGWTEDLYCPEEKLYATTSPFKYSKELVSACCREKLTSLINHYLRSNGYVFRAGGLRLMPCDKTGTGSFQWHHDAWGKSINVMFLLSDTGPADQYMTYVKGSHTLRHSFEKFMHSRVDLHYCKERMAQVEILNTMGKAGDVFIFDPNGIHSGNRTEGNIRDTFTVCYSSDKSHTWGFSFPDGIFDDFSAEKFNPFTRVLARNDYTSPGELFPYYRSWVHGLIAIYPWI